ncbi:hypothetical protein CcCBS67573_g06747 [Chytriomyces confervae]|uniref:Uncharacterized protein n=1 Tax=Chytriomyces confervae TaxID=246404 RepID=A0A507F2E4_9FUNG|nr:hypothetical protein HDU80_004322 [Chytriomyces hyalinus]TPX69855.1 hypothetical protein CcCBS67573_g06747 [Chytriomyces confervae]
MASTLSAAATERNVCIAGAVFFLAYSVLKRTNVVLFEEHPLSFSQDLSLVFGYSAEQVVRAANSISATATPLVIVAAIANVLAILTYAFLGSAMVSWACDSLGKAGQGVKFANQLPFINGAMHLAEAALVTVGLLTVSDELSALASTVSGARSAIAIATLVLGALATGQFLWVWCKSIGRDGRQKIEKQE